MEAPPAVYKLPERFVSITTKAYAVNSSYVTCQAPPLLAYNVEDASVVRAKVFVLENGMDQSQSSATLWYAPSPRALTVYPSGGPRSGGSSVRITTDWNETEWSAAQAAGALDDPREMVGRIHEILEIALERFDESPPPEAGRGA